MFKPKLIYRLITVFLVFALMIVVPFSFTIIKQTQKIISEEETGLDTHVRQAPVELDEMKADVHREFVPRLIDNMVPYIFYILVMAIFLSVFFSRKILLSLKELQKGARAMSKGDLAVRLDVISDDEIGDVMRTFNEMAASLDRATAELRRKDNYINAMLDPLWVVNEENIIVDINLAFTRLFGHQREEVIGRSIYDFFDDGNAEIMRKQLEEKRERGISSIYEISIYAKDGSQMPVLISGSPIYDNGKIVEKIGIFKDFRDQVKFRNELQQSSDYIETVMDSIEQRIMVIDKEYRITKANKIVLKDADTSVIGNYCYRISHGADKPCWVEGGECPAQIVFASGENYRTVHKHKDPSGRKLFHEVIASPIKDASGKVVNVIELLSDISERMLHEEVLMHKNRELLTLNSISSLLSRSLRPDEIFSHVLDKMIEMLGMDGGGMFFIDDAARELTCQYHKGISDEYVKMLGKVRLGEDIPGKVAVTGQLITTADISKDQRVDKSMIKHSGMQGYCCIPIKGKERIIGVFCLFSFSPHNFTPEEESTLSSIGDMTGIAVENIKLYEKMKNLYEFQRKRRDDEHVQLLSLSSKLGEALDLRKIMGSVLDLIRDFFSADFLWLLQTDDDGLILKSSVPSLQRDEELIYQAPVSSIENYAIYEKKPFKISDIQSEQRFYLDPELAGKHYRASVSTPMFIGKKPVGVLSLYYSGPRSFREEELHFLEIIGNMLAVSLERADYYVKSIREKELSDTILQSVADGIITTDTAGKVISVNKTVERMIGVLPEEIIGLPIFDVLGFQQANEGFHSLLQRSFEAALKGKGVREEGTLTTRFGNQIFLLISSDPILNMTGEVTGVVNLFRDISREKEIDRMKTEIVRSVSHEFRTPLSAIVGMTEMILNGDIEEDKVTKYLEIIRKEGGRLSKMVSELLSIARIESGKENLKLGVIDADTLIQSALESLAPQIEGKAADVHFSGNGPVSFVADEEKMRQVLVNILDNALSFSDNNCRIEIEVRKKNDILEMTITDNGWGMPEEDVPYVTERFYRGKQGEKTKGTGLGLSLCHEIIRMHGGTMEIRSKEGEGTSVILGIPHRGAQ